MADPNIEIIRKLPTLIFYQYDLTANFYLTQHCNLACPDCYMLASPQVPKKQIPTEDVNFYLGELKKRENFVPSAVFTGGEVFTLSMDYLQENVQNAFDKNLTVELKTNGKLIAQDVHLRNQFFDMVHNLNIPKKMFSVNNVVACYLLGTVMPATQVKVWQTCYNEEGEKAAESFLIRWAQAYKFNIMTSPLALTVSVDDVVHPIDTRNWFESILTEIVKDEVLREKICLTRLTLNGKSEQQIGCSMRDGYTYNSFEGGKKKNPRNPNYFGKNWLGRPGAFEKGCIMLCFWPDRTVSLESEINLQPIGRVSYVNPNGSYKDLYTIVKDMQAQLLRDYEQKR